jgi:2-succinyl-6-hydroxy-2,4-cyclohexadiene-1-carboxylate synthase
MLLRGEKREKTLVMLHGFMGSSHDMLELADLLSDRFYCIIPDLPGHGKSIFSESTFPEFKDFISLPQMICNLLRLRGVESYSLYGYSMGGRIAAGMALVSPEMIENLVLESSSFGIDDEREREERYKNDLALFEGVTHRKDFLQFLKKWYGMDMFKTLENDMRNSLVIKRSGNDVRELEEAMKIMSAGNQPCFLHELAKRGLNISYIYGTEDLKYRKEAEKAKGRIPGMKLFPVEGASHNVHLQYPEEVTAIIRKLYV